MSEAPPETQTRSQSLLGLGINDTELAGQTDQKPVHSSRCAVHSGAILVKSQRTILNFDYNCPHLIHNNLLSVFKACENVFSVKHDLHCTLESKMDLIPYENAPFCDRKFC